MDEAFRPLSVIIENLLAFRGEYVDEAAGVRSYITACEIESPVELDVWRDAAGRLHIGSTPPLYPLMTTVTPVYHRLRFISKLTVEGDDGRK
jgi:hypothetical protein